MKKALASLALAYTLLPTTEVDNGYTVTVDQPPSAALGREVAVAAGATLTITADNGTPFAAVLIGPSGIVDRVQRKTWSARLLRPGGYRLQFGSESDMLPLQSIVDFVVVPDPAAVASAGTAIADALYREAPAPAAETPPTQIDRE